MPAKSGLYFWAVALTVEGSTDIVSFVFVAVPTTWPYLSVTPTYIGGMADPLCIPEVEDDESVEDEVSRNLSKVCRVLKEEAAGCLFGAALAN